MRCRTALTAHVLHFCSTPHHDTVKPAATYTRDPFTPSIEGDRLYGLGSNDAGASAVALTEVFIELRKASLPFNLLLAITAEEEVGGENGMRAFLPHLQEQGITVSCAIVGEPTGMQAAIAERGLRRARLRDTRRDRSRGSRRRNQCHLPCNF